MSWLVNLVYLFAAVCFILAFKGLAHPRTAVRGNASARGIAAVVVTLLDGHRQLPGHPAGLVVGAGGP
jgi:NAD(P) transhydrogenase subunit beta